MEADEHSAGPPMSIAGIAVTAAVGIVLAIIAFKVLAAVVGMVWFAVKIAAVVAVVALVARFFMKRR